MPVSAFRFCKLLNLNALRRRIPSSGLLRRVAFVRTDVSEERTALVRTEVLKELSASIIRVTRIGELGTTLAVN
jgi:hypothetical protein